MNEKICSNCTYFTRRHLNLNDPWGICDWPNEMVPRVSIREFRYSWETSETYGNNCPQHKRNNKI